MGDLGSVPGLGRSPGEGKGYPLQYSGLENSMYYIVHGITESRTQLSDFHFQMNVYPQHMYHDSHTKCMLCLKILVIFHLLTVMPYTIPIFYKTLLNLIIKSEDSLKIST